MDPSWVRNSTNDNSHSARLVRIVSIQWPVTTFHSLHLSGLFFLGWSIKNPTFREANHLYNQSVSGAVYIYSLNAPNVFLQVKQPYNYRSIMSIVTYCKKNDMSSLPDQPPLNMLSYSTNCKILVYLRYQASISKLDQDDYLGCNPKPCKSFGLEKTQFSSINSEQSTICGTRHQNLRVRSTRIWSCKNVVSSFSPVFRWGGACSSL